uniref:Delta n=1 Tax=Tetraselmis sp. GSL018 TaxID=582737 RepID=A0A061QWG0_9CHLO
MKLKAVDATRAGWDQLAVSPYAHPHAAMASARCKCFSGWKGKLCGEAVCQLGCRHGRCSSPNNCTCEANWKGPTCAVFCVNGAYQAADARGRPSTPCKCSPGWHGKSCTQASCNRLGCKNGVCERPDECVCDPGWRGADCSDNAIAVLAKQVIKDLEFGSSGFRSLTVNRGSSDDTWDHIRGYTSWTAHHKGRCRAPPPPKRHPHGLRLQEAEHPRLEGESLGSMRGGRGQRRAPSDAAGCGDRQTRCRPAFQPGSNGRP